MRSFLHVDDNVKWVEYVGGGGYSTLRFAVAQGVGRVVYLSGLDEPYQVGYTLVHKQHAVRVTDAADDIWRAFKDSPHRRIITSRNTGSWQRRTCTCIARGFKQVYFSRIRHSVQNIINGAPV